MIALLVGVFTQAIKAGSDSCPLVSLWVASGDL